MTRLPLLILLALSVNALAGENATEARKLKLAYAQKLDGLLAKARAAGDSADVKEIEAMIAEAEGKKPGTTKGDETLTPLVGTWQHDGDASVWKIASTTEGTVNGRYQITISHDPEKRRVVVVSPTWVNYLTFTRDPDVMDGSYEANGRTTRFKLKRVK